jgi:hypothetical protein
MTDLVTIGSQLIKQRLGLDLSPLEVTRNDRGNVVSATFQIENAQIRFLNEHGEDFVDLACSFEPAQFFIFDDVDVAFGWKTLEDVLAKKSPEPVGAVFARFAENRAELMAALDFSTYRKTIDQLKRVRQLREQTFVDRLR